MIYSFEIIVCRRQLLSVLASGSLAASAGYLGSDGLRVENFVEYDGLDVTFAGEVLQQPTDDAHARIELRFTNEGPQRVMYFGPIPPASFHEESQTLVAIPDNREPLRSVEPEDPDEFVPDSRGDCWRALCNTIQRRYLQPIRLDRDEELTEQYTLLAHPDAEACFPSGTYGSRTSSRPRSITRCRSTWSFPEGAPRPRHHPAPRRSAATGRPTDWKTP